jgi:hypothetical protein
MVSREVLLSRDQRAGMVFNRTEMVRTITMESRCFGILPKRDASVESSTWFRTRKSHRTLMRATLRYVCKYVVPSAIWAMACYEILTALDVWRPLSLSKCLLSLLNSFSPLCNIEGSYDGCGGAAIVFAARRSPSMSLTSSGTLSMTFYKMHFIASSKLCFFDSCIWINCED